MSAAAPDLSLSYTQFARLPQQLRGGTDDQQGLEQAARQFESIFIDMWLKSAREANQVFAENNLTNSSEMVMQQEMLDHEMAVHLSRNGGIGLAPVIVRQLGGDPEAMQQQPLLQAARDSFAAALQMAGRQPPAGAAAAPETTPETAPEPAADPAAAMAPAAGGTAPDTEKRLAQRAAAFSDPAEFVRTIKPLVEQALRHLPVAGMAVLGQAALETGWGQHVITDAAGNLSHNLFGIKAQADESNAVSVSSREFEHGRWLERKDHFRTYEGWQDSVNDYVDTITRSPRYRQAVAAGADVDGYLQALQQAGYATDPHYAEKISAVVRSISNMGF